MFRPGSLRRMFSLLAIVCAPVHADVLPTLQPQKLVSPLGSSVGDGWTFYDGPLQRWGVTKRLTLDPSIPALTGQTFTPPADALTGLSILAATPQRLLYARDVVSGPRPVELRNASDYSLIRSVTLPDGWAWGGTESAIRAETTGDNIVARVVSRLSSSIPNRYEIGCAFIDLGDGAIQRVINLGLAPAGMVTFLYDLDLGPDHLAAVVRSDGGSAQLSLYDRATGLRTARTAVPSYYRVLSISDNRLFIYNGNGYQIVDINLGASSLVPVGSSSGYDVSGSIRGGHLWVSSPGTGNTGRYRRYDISNVLHPVLEDDLSFPPDADSVLPFTPLYGPDWIALLHAGARFDASVPATVDFYDLSTGALNHLPVVRISATAAREQSHLLTATLTLDKPSPVDTSVRVRTADATAHAGLDYTAIDRRVTIPAGALTATTDITLIEDDVIEPHESFSLLLSDPTGLRPATGPSPAVILGTGMGRWERPMVPLTDPSDIQAVGTSIGTPVAATETRLASIVPYGTANTGKLAIFDMATLKLLKIVNVPIGSSGYTCDQDGSRLRIMNPIYGGTQCASVDLETGDAAVGFSPETITNYFGQLPHVWLDSHRILTPTPYANTWTLHDVQASTASTIPGASQVSTSCFFSDSRYLAAVVYLRDDPTSVSGPGYWYLTLHDPATLALLRTIPLPRDRSYAEGAVFLSADHAAVTGNGAITVLDLATGAPLWSDTLPSSNGDPLPRIWIRDGVVVRTDIATGGCQVRDLLNGAVLDLYAPNGTGGRFVSPSGAGWFGFGSLKAFGLLAAPREPRFDPVTFTTQENVPAAVTLAPLERFSGARPIIWTEDRRTYGGTQPYEFTVPGSGTVLPANASSTMSIVPVNDRAVRTGNRTAVLNFATTAHPLDVICPATGTVTEDDQPVIPQGYVSYPGTDAYPGASLMAVSSQWIVAGDGWRTHVFSAATGAYLRSLPEITNNHPITTITIAGNHVFSSSPSVPMTVGTRTYPNVGLVYVHDLTTGQLVTTLANNNTRENFGVSLAASDRWLAVGGTTHLTTGTWATNGGTVSIFDLTTLKRVLLKTSTVPSFGISVALYGDRVYVGACDASYTPKGGTKIDGVGNVQPFAIPKGTALPVILPPVAAYGTFGRNLAIAGDRLAVTQPGYRAAGKGGVGAVHVYTLPDQALYMSIDPQLADGSAGSTADLSQPIALSGNTLAFGFPQTFVDLSTKRFLGSWLLGQDTGGGMWNAPIAIQDGWFYWAGRTIYRRALPVYPTPPVTPEPPQPSPYPVGFTGWTSGLLPAATDADRLPNADPDGDGLKNWQEFLVGSHPGQGGSRSGFIARSTGWFSVQYRRVDPSYGWPVHPEFSTDLIHWTRELPDWCHAWSQGTANGVETIELDVETAASSKGWVRFSFTE